jgi:hypothetical protein
MTKLVIRLSLVAGLLLGVIAVPVISRSGNAMTLRAFRAGTSPMLLADGKPAPKPHPNTIGGNPIPM